VTALNRPSQVIFASGARSAVTSSDVQNYESGRGAMLILHSTVTPGANATLELQLEVKDPVSDAWLPFTDFTPVTPLTGDSFNFIVYPNEAGTYTAPNTQHISSPLPSYWRAKVSPVGGSHTFSLAAVFME